MQTPDERTSRPAFRVARCVAGSAPDSAQRCRNIAEHTLVDVDIDEERGSEQKRRTKKRSAAKRNKNKNYSNFSVINGNCGLALANDLTVPFPTPQKRQPFEAQDKQVCRTPGKDPLAAVSDVGFRTVAIFAEKFAQRDVSHRRST